MEQREKALNHLGTQIGATHAMLYVGDQIGEAIRALKAASTNPADRVGPRQEIDKERKVRANPAPKPEGITTDPVTEEEKGRSK